VNSAVSSALIAGILSGVSTMAGVLLGTKLQSRSAGREQARAAAGQRDEILASLAGAVGSASRGRAGWSPQRAALRRTAEDPADVPRRQLGLRQESGGRAFVNQLAIVCFGCC
jgi:hypothetical protein